MGIEKKYNMIIDELRDFFEGTNNRSVIGLSGGIDSAVVAVLLADAVGGDNLLCVNMPFGDFNNPKGIEDSGTLAKNLGATFKIKKIDEIVNAVLNQETLVHNQDDYSYECGPREFGNIQCRTRGLMLMTLGNIEHRRVIDCSNKSEVFTGYMTMYGDTVGGISPIGDLLKREVYELAEFLNSKNGGVIPEGIINRAPSAELGKGQKDEEDLLPYSIVDSFIEDFYSGDGMKELVEKYGRNTYDKLFDLFMKSSWKREQLPPIIYTS